MRSLDKGPGMHPGKDRFEKLGTLVWFHELLLGTCLVAPLCPWGPKESGVTEHTAATNYHSKIIV